MDKKLLIVLVAALFLVGGVFVLTQKKQNQVSIEPAVNNSGQAQQEGQSKPPETKNFEPVQGEPDYVWFPVSELGIEIKVRKIVSSELLYQAKEITTPDRAEFVSAQFTTRGLIGIGKKLYQKVLEEDGSYVCGLGSFGVYRSIPADFYTNEIYEYTKNHGVKTEDGFFVWYDSPQAPCSSNQGSEDAKYESALQEKWWGRPTSEYTETQNLLYHLQKAVRKIQ